MIGRSHSVGIRASGGGDRVHHHLFLKTDAHAPGDYLDKVLQSRRAVTGETFREKGDFVGSLAGALQGKIVLFGDGK